MGAGRFWGQGRSVGGRGKDTPRTRHWGARDEGTVSQVRGGEGWSVHSGKPPRAPEPERRRPPPPPHPGQTFPKLPPDPVAPLPAESSGFRPRPWCRFSTGCLPGTEQPAPLGHLELLLPKRPCVQPLPALLGLPHSGVGGQSQALLSSGHRAGSAAALRTGLLGAVGHVSGGKGCPAGLATLR